jgi:hypothetical protein
MKPNATPRKMLGFLRQPNLRSYGPELDVDLTEEIILHPERFPLKAR